MKRQYRITPEGPPRLTDAEIARYRDPKRLIYNYTKAVQRPKRPLYKDPKAFIFLLLIVLLAYLISEGRLQPDPTPRSAPEQEPPVRTGG
ncbi:MAG: hypothetical protein KF797_07940 [Flavobacteriales bacterium]|nr:hypothetical protein [Flavobacteriales bacterium]